jgi:peptidoglycan-associated lipoprotein
MQTSLKPSRFQTLRATLHKSSVGSTATALNTNEMLGVQPHRRGRVVVLLAGVAVAFGAGYWLVGSSVDDAGTLGIETAAEESTPTATSLALQRPLESLDRLETTKAPVAKSEPASTVRVEATKDAPAAIIPKLEMTLSPKSESGLQAGQFLVDSAELTPATQELLDKWAARLKSDKRINLKIEGHADERGTAGYNDMLGQRRANAARLYLIAKGVPSKQIEAATFGKRRPLVKGESESAWTKNRRIELKPGSKLVAKSSKVGSSAKKGSKLVKSGAAKAKSKGKAKAKSQGRQLSRS